MNYRLRAYGSLLLVIMTCLIYLLMFMRFSSDLSDNQVIRIELQNIIQQNSRWITWGICAASLGLLCGIFGVVMLFLTDSDDDFFQWLYKDLVTTWLNNELFFNWRYIGGFLVIASLIFTLTRGDILSGLRNVFELIGVVVWLIFIITTTVFLLIIMADILKFLVLTVSKLYKQHLAK